MTKSNVIQTVLVVSITLLFFHSCNKNNTTEPERPKPRAKITVEVAHWPLHIDTQWWPSGISVKFEVIVTESNGLGGRVSTCKATLYKDDNYIVQDTIEGDRFEPYGTWSCAFNLWCPGDNYKFDTLTIIVKGGDDNDYPFEEQVSYTGFTWEDVQQ